MYKKICKIAIKILFLSFFLFATSTIVIASQRQDTSVPGAEIYIGDRKLEKVIVGEKIFGPYHVMSEAVMPTASSSSPEWENKYQCYGFAMYCQYALCGECEFNQEYIPEYNTYYTPFVKIRVGGKTTKKYDDSRTYREFLKQSGLLQTWRGIHIRDLKTGTVGGSSNHSMIVSDCDNGTVSIVDSNFSTNHDNLVRTARFKSWDDFFDWLDTYRKGIDYISVYNPGGGNYIGASHANITSPNGTLISTQEETPIAVTPDSIVHIDNPHGNYNGDNHVEISGWIVSKYDLTYVMGECEAFGQINLSGTLTDASEELNNAGYVTYPVKKRFRSVIDRKYLQPNTEYTMKVWAGLSNGGVSGVCSQRFNVTSIEPVVINITGPSSSSFAAGKDVTISGNIFSLNPITDVIARLDDINGSSQVVNFDLDLKTGSGSDTYPYGYTFSGTLPLSEAMINNTTASVFVTAIDQNNIQKTKARTFTIGKVVVGDLGNYQFNFNQESVRIYGSGVQTLSGTVYANGPIADVMAAIAHWTGGKQVQLAAKVQEITPPAGYHYAKSFSLNVSAGNLCNILDVDSFEDGEFRAVFWADLVSDSGQGINSQTGIEQKIYGTNVTRPSYTVNYNANGGSGAPGAGSFKHGSGHTISSTIPSRTGYSFRGWTTSSSSNQVIYSPGSSYSNNSSITLYAVWEKAVNIPTDLISYNFNASVTIKNAPKVFKLVPSETTKYRFTASGSAGANVVIQNTSGGTADSFSNGSKATKEVILNANQTYYIVVKPNTQNTIGKVSVSILRSYKITFDAAGGTGAPSGTYYQYAGEGLTLPTSVPGHSPVTITYIYDEFGTQTQQDYNVMFDSWGNFDFGTDEVWEPGAILDNNRSLILTALWDYQMIEEPEAPEKAGWIIAGWKDEEGREVDLQDCIALEDTSYYAVWTPAVPLEGITVSPEKLNLRQGEQAGLAVTQIPENAFDPEVVWESSNPDVASVSADGQVTALSEGVSIITATVVGNEEYVSSAVISVGSGELTVVYDANGGEGAPDSRTVAYGESFSIPNDVPTRTGYTFLGWSFDKQAEKESFCVGDSVTIDRDRTLYAIWIPNEFTISFDANGGEDAPDAQTKVYDEELVLSNTIPVREGFGFAGWAVDPSSTKAEYAAGGIFEINQDTVLYAVWLEHAEGITLNYSTLALSVGQQKALKADVNPEGAAGTAVRWKSSDESVVTVKNGLVTAVSSGQAVITCTVPENTDITASCTVRVAPLAAQEGALDTPVALEYAVKPGDDISLSLKFISGNAAYAKILYSYDETALELKSASAEGTHVTLGNKAVVLAVSNGKIPDGTQAKLVFHVKDEAEPGSYKVDTAVVECYTIDEEDTNLFASASDGVRIRCAQHSVEIVSPVIAAKDKNGLSAGRKCSVCGEVLTEQSVIESGKCYWLPDSLIEIEEEAFEGLPVQQIVLSDSTTTIGNRAFKGCEQLLLVIIPETVTEIGDDAFDGCGDVCIMAPSGSYAEQYARNKNLSFVPMEE